MTPTAAPQQTKKRRDLYHRNTDRDIFTLVANFPLISPEEIARLTGRNVIRIRKRLRQFRLAGYMDAREEASERIDYLKEIVCSACGNPNLLLQPSGRFRPQPGLHYLTAPKGEREALKYAGHVAAAWTDKSALMVPHDRGINRIHLSLHDSFGPRIGDWRQQREDLMESATVDGERVNYYPDARFTLDGQTFWLEYTRANPSSEDGETDVIKKVRRYNALFTAHRKLHNRDAGKVLFVYEEKGHIPHFLERVAEEFPYRWCMVTDIESVKHNSTGAICWTPRDFDTRTHGLIDEAA